MAEGAALPAKRDVRVDIELAIRRQRIPLEQLRIVGRLIHCYGRVMDGRKKVSIAADEPKTTQSFEVGDPLPRPLEKLGIDA